MEVADPVGGSSLIIPEEDYFLDRAGTLKHFLELVLCSVL